MLGLTTLKSTSLLHSVIA